MDRLHIAYDMSCKITEKKKILTQIENHVESVVNSFDGIKARDKIE